MIIRAETPKDYKIIYEVNEKAFENNSESKLIDKIRTSENYIPELSLVALKEKEIVGHILFSKLKIVNEKGGVEVLSLAPMCVLPEYQNQGIGSELVEKGLRISKDLDYNIIIIVGHPNYYPRFGFTPAREKGLEVSLKMEIPDEAFMVCELEKDTLKDVTGIVEYPAYFEGN